MLVLRSLVFYIVYIITLLLHSFVCLTAGHLMSMPTRYRYFTLWNRFVSWWLKVSCNLRYEIVGAKNVPHGTFVLLSNHQSPWETIVFYDYFRPVCATLKQELLNIPFFGWGMRMLNPIAIDRSKRREARNLVLREGKQRFNDGISVLIFPEGTRVEPGQRRKFSYGGAELAIAANVPVLPVAHDAGKYWPAHRLVKHPGTIRVIIGKPIATEGREARELTQEVLDWIYDSLDAGKDVRQ